MSKTKSTWEILSKINVNDKVEKKNGLSYLSWAWAWGIVKEHFPNATYRVYENEFGLNYHHDGMTGWVKTGVRIDDIEHIEYLPIMDYRNKARVRYFILSHSNPPPFSSINFSFLFVGFRFRWRPLATRRRTLLTRNLTTKASMPSRAHLVKTSPWTAFLRRNDTRHLSLLTSIRYVPPPLPTSHHPLSLYTWIRNATPSLYFAIA